MIDSGLELCVCDPQLLSQGENSDVNLHTVMQSVEETRGCVPLSSNS